VVIVSYGALVGEHQRSAAEEVLHSLRSLNLSDDETAQFHDAETRSGSAGTGRVLAGLFGGRARQFRMGQLRTGEGFLTLRLAGTTVA
jgi:hypothetical protein